MQFPDLRMLLSPTTTESHIDLSYCAAQEIDVISLKDDSTFLREITSTPEHALGLLMACHRLIPAVHSDVLQGRWDRYYWGAPKMLSHSSLLILGRGRVGSHLKLIAHSIFNLVDVWDIQDNTSLDLYIGDYDFISVNIGSDDLVMDARAISRMRQGSILVNTARGSNVDLDCLIEALEDHRIRAAGLDVLIGDTLYGFTETVSFRRAVEYAERHNNLILTPHIAGSTLDAWEMTQHRVIEKAAKKLGVTLASCGVHTR